MNIFVPLFQYNVRVWKFEWGSAGRSAWQWHLRNTINKLTTITMYEKWATNFILCTLDFKQQSETVSYLVALSCRFATLTSSQGLTGQVLSSSGQLLLCRQLPVPESSMKARSSYSTVKSRDWDILRSKLHTDWHERNQTWINLSWLGGLQLLIKISDFQKAALVYSKFVCSQDFSWLQKC